MFYESDHQKFLSWIAEQSKVTIFIINFNSKIYHKTTKRRSFQICLDHFKIVKKAVNRNIYKKYTKN